MTLPLGVKGGRGIRNFHPSPPLTIPLNPLKPTKVGDLSYLVRLAVQQCRPEYRMNEISLYGCRAWFLRLFVFLPLREFLEP